MVGEHFWWNMREEKKQPACKCNKKEKVKERASRGGNGGHGIQRVGKTTKTLKARMKRIQRLAKSSLGKTLWGQAIKYPPSLYKKGVSRINNNKIRKVLNSNLANTAVSYGLEYARNKLSMY